MRRPIILFLYLLSTLFLFAEGAGETDTTAGVLATTSWTAAFADAAGLEDIRVLAPYELQHPPEYELTPGDIRAIAEARIIIFAGYELMLDRLRESSDSQAEMIQIETVNTWPVINESVRKIAAAAGTSAQAEENLAEIQAFFSDWRGEMEEYRGTRVITHLFLQGLARNLGFEVVGTFGPAPLEAKQLKELSESGAALIIDNWHSKVGTPLKEVLSGTPTVEMINFPGRDETRTLLDVLRYNRAALKAALQ